MPARPPAKVSNKADSLQNVRKPLDAEKPLDADKPLDAGKPLKSGKPCPICGKPSVPAAQPFCSERCRDVDLNRWLSNSYTIPGRSSEDEDTD